MPYKPNQLAHRMRHDRTGQRFGQLTVLSHAGTHGERGYQWLCQCDCGRQGTFLGVELARGRVVSCGCRREAAGMRAKPGGLFTAAELRLLRLSDRAESRTAV